MKTPTTMDDPVNLPLPPEWPQPRPDCARCADLARQRDEARAAADFSRVTDCNVRMRSHPVHGRKQPQ
ncbi:hypothetical protein JTP67_21360 [Streptomyces sp. S12]|nr:hypothetical protein [Streptomyces sp. S12]